MTEADLINFKHKIDLDLRYDDLDTMGHVNNKAYLTYLEEARISYHETVVGFDKKTLQFNAVVGRIDIIYKHPIFLDDHVQVFTRCSHMGKRSFDLESVIVACKKGDLLNKRLATVAITTLVSIDMLTGKSKEISQSAVEKMLAYEIVKPNME